MNFEAYLASKKIDSSAFQKAEPHVWENWQKEFDQMHPATFTAQKLYLINPVRRKYVLKEIPVDIPKDPSVTSAAPAAKPKPMMRPKPKIG